ncbi:choice-of-anchor D domain-containing protein [Candidatus Electronema sp. PJ]|uniref:choice-of-anchor D domain-containing protein n=1 Tax=Candidatus Electronema sp. PJ TaxID=3401572 RepID=UPI003AA7B99F
MRKYIQYSCVSILLLSSPAAALAAQEVFQTSEPIYRQRVMLASYPTDPPNDTDWLASCDKVGVASIQCAFNNARTAENTMLNTALPMLSLPDQATWDAMSDGEKALWLINRERLDRGVDALHGIESNVTGVAQYYAQYLLTNNKWGHSEDGRDPWERLADNPAIGACSDFLNIAENLAVFMTTGNSIPLPVERSVYGWMYDDSTSDWGHRHAILWYPYDDNSGTAGKEGFLGIGRYSGPYTDWNSKDWNFAQMIVMNVFDPCASWSYPPQGPEIDSQGNNTSISNGDSTPSATDHTHFGYTAVNTPVSRTFTLANTGDADLTLTLPIGLTGGECQGFSITTQPATSVVAAQGTTTFTVQYTPSNPGDSNTCTVSITNDDSDENPYTFVIRGAEGIEQGAEGLIPTYRLLL